MIINSQIKNSYLITKKILYLKLNNLRKKQRDIVNLRLLEIY